MRGRTPQADWDLGYVAGPGLDLDALFLELATILGTDAVDLVDLERAGGLLRYRAASDGIPVYHRTEDAFARFRLSAVHFWCDMGLIIQAGYDEILAELPR